MPVQPAESVRLSRTVRTEPTRLPNHPLYRAGIGWSRADLVSGSFRIPLYRFLADHVPVVSACVNTWARLSAASGKFVAEPISPQAKKAEARLSELSTQFSRNALGQPVGLPSLLPELFLTLYRDGGFGAFLRLTEDGSRVAEILPVDSSLIAADQDRPGKLILRHDQHDYSLDRADFRYLPLSASAGQPMGRSILQAVPFVAYIEQQLISDMQRASHNSGYHRLHIKIDPPERMAGESDAAYTTRINRYFDDTVEMMRSCEIDDNPVTWNNIEIGYIGPEGVRTQTTSWFVNHRAMIEEICAGTNLAPFLLGYSYGATTTWSEFKFDLVMRQVRSVQAEVSSFLEWVAQIDLALAGIDCPCRFEFDNSFGYQIKDQLDIQTRRVDNLLKLFQAGLVPEADAKDEACRLLKA